MRLGRIDEAAEALRAIGDDVHIYTSTITAVAEGLVKAGKIDDALNAAAALKASKSRDNALGAIVRELARAGKIGEALRAAATIGADCVRFEVLGTVAKDLVNTDKIGEALEAVRAIEDEYNRAGALTTIVDEMIMAGNGTASLDAAYTVKNPTYRSHILTNVSAAFVKNGEIEAGLRAWYEAMKMPLQISPVYGDGFSAVSTAVHQFVKAGKADEILAAAREVRDGFDRSIVLTAIGEGLTREGKTAQAAEVLREALANIPRSGPYSYASYASYPSYVLAMIGARLTQAGQRDTGSDIFEQAFAATRMIEPDEEWFSANTFIAGE
ncbi:MAG: hypothetical protein ACREYC_17695, partial [Gammaproteobacteria bacterium]